MSRPKIELTANVKAIGVALIDETSAGESLEECIARKSAAHLCEQVVRHGRVVVVQAAAAGANFVVPLNNINPLLYPVLQLFKPGRHRHGPVHLHAERIEDTKTWLFDHHGIGGYFEVGVALRDLMQLRSVPSVKPSPR